MTRQYAYSICDMMDRIGPASVQEEFRKAGLIYIGSYFCDLYFLSVPEKVWEAVLEEISGQNKNAVLVVPVPSQRNLDAVKEKVRHLLKSWPELIAELVVNDPAFLLSSGEWGGGRDVWCGRLFSKEIRDPRYPHFRQNDRISGHISEDGTLLGTKVAGYEKEMYSDGRGSVSAAVHVPLSYISMGRHCEIGSIRRTVTEKFRLWDGCSRPCRENWNVYRNGGVTFLKFGRAVYALQKHGEDAGSADRVIYDGIADLVREDI